MAPESQDQKVVTITETTTDTEKQSEQAPLHTTFTTRQRIFIVTMTALASFFSPLSGQIYFPAIPLLAQDYHTSVGKINLTITTYMILQGFAPTIMGSFGDTTGRRPAYIVTFALYFAANIGLATQKSYAALLVLRCLQSAGSSGTIALGFGVVADICTPAERGKYLGPVAAGVMLAPSFGPTIGGLLTHYLGWRSIFWFLSVISGVYLFFYILFMPETARKVVGDGSIVPRNWYSMSVVQYWKARQKSKSEIEADREAQKLDPKPKFRLPNPWDSIKVLREKDALVIILYISLTMTAFMSLMASMPSLYGEVYGFNSLQVGFCYIPFGISAGLAAILNGKLMDFNYRRWAKKLNMPLEKKRQTDLRDFPIEKVRLQPVFIFVPIAVATYLPIGWVLQERVNLAVPLILNFIGGFCVVACSNTLQSLLVDLFPDTPAIVMATSNLLRCWTAGAGAAAISPMLNAMGWGWCFFFWGLVILFALSFLWFEYMWGMRWREQRRLRMAKKKEELEQKGEK
ncbi:MFS general substrate transporter [Microthyrium microscopicum]|uniref:MFS general substrate transporter n=1 Tax=Microthyrium microscopicum TaxID=703497 RepID=A0A6A6U2Z6_9PEZI|nr:MFS general substrate transporter [Microthyrium microscopicum]